MKTLARISVFAFLLLSVACERTSAAPPASESAAPVVAAPSAPAPPAPAAAPPPSTPAPTGGDTIALADLQAGFASDPQSWTGTTRTVRGLFVSATRAGGELNSISLTPRRDAAFNESFMCAFGENPPASVDLTQYTEVTVRGRVETFFNRPSLRDCSIVAQ